MPIWDRAYVSVPVLCCAVNASSPAPISLNETYYISLLTQGGVMAHLAVMCRGMAEQWGKMREGGRESSKTKRIEGGGGEKDMEDNRREMEES